MDDVQSPKKKLKSPGVDSSPNINAKTSVTCSDVPESLFEAAAAKKHFSKFGRVQRIRLFPKKQMCIIEYDQPTSVERAVLNAGAYDGFMFDVTRTKPRVRRKSKREDDPDWVPDSEVEEELNAMGATPIYRTSRQKPMDVDAAKTQVKSPIKTIRRTIKQVPAKPTITKVSPSRLKSATGGPKSSSSQPTSGIESPVVVPTTTTMSTNEAAIELNQLRSRISLTPDEQWRTLDARDRILRAWGGAGSRVKIGGATIGTCPDMCPEKELLHRQAEHQVMTLETIPDSDGLLEPWRAVKQYSRSSADQEIPMCYELRPPTVLMRTCAYLLHEIADTKRQVSLADWFHFMWDRFRGIRKDITQQALCCAESICLVEMCARFHAHCSARLADLEHTQFDQKLNTDNLTKCLQTLKHMYADVGPEIKPREAEFRGYIALLNLGDANFWWEIKQLPLEMQKSAPITFAIKVFNALDNNNYVRFFRLVQEEATYLQACILLRYFNDVRARALARIVKAFAPRGGSKYPAEDLMETLRFESVESMKNFISHYGLRFAKDESELCIILDRHQFTEDSDPYPVARSINLIESKRTSSVGQVIAGGTLPHYNYAKNSVYSSFNKDGRLKETALIAEDQGYNTLNDSNKDVELLKNEIKRLTQGGRPNYATADKVEPTRTTLFVKPDTRTLSPGKPTVFAAPQAKESKDKINNFSFKPAIPVASKEIIKNSPEKLFSTDTKSIFSFSKPVDTGAANIFKPAAIQNNLFTAKASPGSSTLFANITNENKDPLPNSQNVFKKSELSNVFKKPEASNVFKQPEESNIFKKSEMGKTVFVSQYKPEVSNGDINKNVFANATESSFGKNIFAKTSNEAGDNGPKSTNIFAKATQEISKDPKSVFGSFNKPLTNNIFAKSEPSDNKIPPTNGDVSPGSLFKSAINSDGQSYSIFQSKNKTSVADNIFNSVQQRSDFYDFDQVEDEAEEQLKQQKLYEEQVKADMERKIQERMREEQEKKRREEELRRKEEERQREEERKRLEELKRLEEKRRKEEERKQDELRRKLEEERQAEIKRKAEEEARKFKERVERESTELVDELLIEVRDETVKELLVDEIENMRNLEAYANAVTEEICSELCDELVEAEMKAEKFWTHKLRKKWFHIWRRQFHRNFKRRRLLDDTPVWLPDRTPDETANNLRRVVEGAALKHMNAIHSGYKFNGELKLLPAPKPYNVVDIIRSPLLKRMKQIKYPYDKCYFWKVTLVSPGNTHWMCRKILLETWLYDVFSDNKRHETSESLIRVEKQSWNNLMDFAISVSVTNPQNKNCDTAVEGTNGILFYTTENDTSLISRIEETLKQKYPFQIVPVTVVMPKTKNGVDKTVEHVLESLVGKNLISCFKIFLVDSENISESLNTNTKSALKWMARKYPETPPLEVDYLKSMCCRYLGNEIWYRLKAEGDTRMKTVLKDLQRLVKCYNVAVDKLTELVTNEDLFNYPAFPLEFNEFLDQTTPYPKPFEFIPTNSRNSGNVSAIRDMMQKLKLPDVTFEFNPIDVPSMQSQMRTYCKQIGWFEDPEQVVCKVVAKLPTQFADLNMPCDQFSQYFEQYDLIDFLNIVVYEKISRLQNFDNRFAIYERSALEEYRRLDWLYEIEVFYRMKHKPLDYGEDELDVLIEAKRRKIALDSMEYLMLEDTDCTIVEENIKAANESISKISDCNNAVKQLEEQIELEKIKSMELENLLKSALSNV